MSKREIERLLEVAVAEALGVEMPARKAGSRGSRRRIRAS
jgi:hypothetical protein